MTPVQAAHVAKAFPENREQMADFLAAGVEVFCEKQIECGPDIPAIAIRVAAMPEFWIDCCNTVKAAKSKAQSLGLVVKDLPKQPHRVC